jgi:hypothetical protein
MCVLATLWGHHLGSHPDRLPPRNQDNYLYRPQSVWYVGVFLMLVGITAQYTFFNAMSSGRADYSTSGYWYMLFHVFYPGLAMCVRLYCGHRQYQTPSCLILLMTLSAIFLYYWVSQVRRGPIFSYFIAVAYTYYLTTRLVNRAVLIGGLVFVGLLMLLFIFIRDYSTPGGSWRAEQLQRVNVEDLVFQKAQMEDDNEYLYHCGYVATVIELDRYQYGTGFLNLGIHWIPRQWWLEKPTLLDQGWFPKVLPFDMKVVLGWTMTNGAAVGGIAESFQQVGWFMPLYWFAVGWVVGRLFALAHFRTSVMRVTLYVGALGITHYLVAQGLMSAFVPLIFYTVVPLMTYLVFREQAPVRRRAAPVTAPVGARPPSPLAPASGRGL